MCPVQTSFVAPRNAIQAEVIDRTGLGGVLLKAHALGSKPCSDLRSSAPEVVNPKTGHVAVARLHFMSSFEFFHQRLIMSDHFMTTFVVSLGVYNCCTSFSIVLSFGGEGAVNVRRDPKFSVFLIVIRFSLHFCILLLRNDQHAKDKSHEIKGSFQSHEAPNKEERSYTFHDPCVPKKLMVHAGACQHRFRCCSAQR